MQRMHAIIIFLSQTTPEALRVANACWNWLLAERFAVLVVVCFGSMLCLALLAVHVRTLGKQLSALLRTTKRHSALAEQHAVAIDELAGLFGELVEICELRDKATMEFTLERTSIAPAISTPAPVATFNAALRDGIESIIADMKADVADGVH
jgi:hypothetical protein